MGRLVGQFHTPLLRQHDVLFGGPITRETSAIIIQQPKHWY